MIQQNITIFLGVDYTIHGLGEYGHSFRTIYFVTQIAFLYKMFRHKMIYSIYSS